MHRQYSDHSWAPPSVKLVSERSIALPIVAVWKQAAFYMIFDLARLQSMRPDLAVAAA